MPIPEWREKNFLAKAGEERAGQYKSLISGVCVLKNQSGKIQFIHP